MTTDVSSPYGNNIKLLSNDLSWRMRLQDTEEPCETRLSSNHTDEYNLREFSTPVILDQARERAALSGKNETGF